MTEHSRRPADNDEALRSGPNVEALRDGRLPKCHRHLRYAFLVPVPRDEAVAQHFIHATAEFVVELVLHGLRELRGPALRPMTE